MYIYTMYIFQNFYGSSVPFLREFLQRVFFCMSAPDSPPNWDARNGVIVNAARNYSKTTTITSFCKCIYIYIYWNLCYSVFSQKAGEIHIISTIFHWGIFCQGYSEYIRTSYCNHTTRKDILHRGLNCWGFLRKKAT